jgi:hypothetical protein
VSLVNVAGISYPYFFVPPTMHHNDVSPILEERGGGCNFVEICQCVGLGERVAVVIQCRDTSVRDGVYQGLKIQGIHDPSKNI